MNAPHAALISGARLHLQHGPIDLILGADGPPGAREAAFTAAKARFETILEELVAELEALRRPLDGAFSGAVARRMAQAVAPFSDVFITPMAAVAGAVAEEVLAAMVAAAPLSRAYVNNGGDIALHLPPASPPGTLAARAAPACPLPERGTAPPVSGSETGSARPPPSGGRFTPPRRPGAALPQRTAFTIAIAAPDASPLGTIAITAESPVRGIATSGRGGRSLSRGIAESVTVLARSPAMADAAATLICNAVDLPGHPAITRAPAQALQPDSDLGAREVVTALGPISAAEAETALARGAACARAMQARGLIHSAALFLRGRHKLAGPLPLAEQERLEHA